MFIFNCYVDLSLEVASNDIAVFCFHVYIWAGCGTLWAGIWSNWSLFQSCYFPMWFGKKSLHTKSKKYKEAFWLTNLVSFKFSSCGESWKITSEKRLLVTYRRDCSACTWDSAFCRLHGVLPNLWWMQSKPIDYWIWNKTICVAFRFMTSEGFSQT